MSKPGMRLFAAMLAGLSLAGAGCMSNADGSHYKAPYRRVDQESPAFKAAKGKALAAEQAKGKSAKEAEKSAVRKVTREFVATEKASREEQVAPLVAALVDFERPRGCWAYTVTTTRIEGGRTTVLVERFNPYEPEGRLWTLVRGTLASGDGWTPTEKGQADYRRNRLRKWKKQQERTAKRPPESIQAGKAALFSQIVVTPAAESGALTFTFEREPLHIALIGDIPRSRETYSLDPSGRRILRHTSTNLGVGTMPGIRIEASDSATDYIVVEEGLPPFPARTVMQYRMRLFGKDSGDVTVETTYSDYRKVKCYDDRFSVKLGELNVMDFVPDRE